MTPDRIQKERPAPQERKAEEKVEAKSNQSEEILEEAADWLDEIDAVLQENAEEFVKAYVQKGGE